MQAARALLDDSTLQRHRMDSLFADRQPGRVQ
jgi:hypothetical protein